MASDIRNGFNHSSFRAGARNMDGISAITPEQLMDVCDVHEKIVVVNWNGLKLVIRRTIDIEETFDFVGYVLNECWTGENYQPEMVEFAFRSAVIMLYSNITLPEDKYLRHNIVYRTNLYETVIKSIDKEQLDSIREAIKIYMNV